jgi:hypothetical protein
MIEPRGFVENPVPVQVRGATTRAPYWVATFDFLNPEIRSLAKQNDTIGLTWSEDGVRWPSAHGVAVDLRSGLGGKDPWWKVIRTPHGLIDEGDGTYTCFFTATSRKDGGFRGLGMSKLRLVETITNP